MGFRCSLLLSLLAAAPVAGYYGNSVAPSNASTGFLLPAAATKLENELSDAISDAFGNGLGLQQARYTKVQAEIASTWKSLDKNADGLICLRSFRYLVHRHMLRRHYISVVGLEPGLQGSDEAKLLAHVPLDIKATLEGTTTKIGFSLDDTIAMIIMLQELVAHQEADAVTEAFNSLDFDIQVQVGSHWMNVAHVVSVHMLRWLLGPTYDAYTFLDQSASAKENEFKGWTLIEDYIRGRLLAHEYTRAKFSLERRRGDKHNPFNEAFFVNDVTTIVGEVVMNFGEYWRPQCDQAKEKMVKMDYSATGRVKLSDFHGAALNGEWRFGESKDYLRALGALDETTPSSPRVILANYVQGTSNCIKTDARYRVCCQNDCEGYMSEIEVAIAAPVAKPEQLIEIVSSFTLNLQDESPKLTPELKAQLQKIAAAHNGDVPIHGRLFAQWLHYVFPRDCPFPHKAGSVWAVSPDSYGHNYAASRLELEEHAYSNSSSDRSEEFMAEWSHDEELLTSLTAPWEQSVLPGRFLTIGGLAVAAFIAVSVSGSKHESLLASAKNMATGCFVLSNNEQYSKFV